MMKPTDEQLRDPKWWDENAPEGATHYDDRYLAPWRRSEKGCEFYFSAVLHNWVSTSRTDSAGIPRPTKPAAPEWVDGLPPVGCECEFQPASNEPWYVVEVIAYFEGSAVFAAGDDYPNGCYDGCSHPENFRPPRTKEQREREELVDIVCGQGFLSKDGNVSWEIANAIMAAGYRKEKQDD